MSFYGGDSMIAALPAEKADLAFIPNSNTRIFTDQLYGATSATDIQVEYPPENAVISSVLQSQPAIYFELNKLGVHNLRKLLFKITVNYSGGTAVTNDITLNPAPIAFIDNVEVQFDSQTVQRVYGREIWERIIACNIDEDMKGIASLNGFAYDTKLPNVTLAAGGSVTKTFYIPFYSCLTDSDGWPMTRRDKITLVFHPANQTTQTIQAGTIGAATLAVTDLRLQMRGDVFNDPSDLASFTRDTSTGVIQKRFLECVPVNFNASASWSSTTQGYQTQTINNGGRMLSHALLNIGTNATAANLCKGIQINAYNMIAADGSKLLYRSADMLDEQARNDIIVDQFDSRWTTDTGSSNQYWYLVSFSRRAQKAWQTGLVNGYIRLSGNETISITPASAFTGNERVTLDCYFFKALALTPDGVQVVNM